MTKSREYLEAFESGEMKEKSVYYLFDRIDLVFVSYLTVWLLVKYIYFKDPFNSFTFYQLIFGVLIPLFLWFLFIKKYKIGWFLRNIFYSNLLIVLGLNLLSKSYQGWLQLHLIFLLCISCFIVVTSFFKRTLRNQKIGSKVIVAFSLLFVFLLLAFVYGILIYKR